VHPPTSQYLTERHPDEHLPPATVENPIKNIKNIQHPRKESLEVQLEGGGRDSKRSEEHPSSG